MSHSSEIPAWAMEKAKGVYMDACLHGLTEPEWISSIARAIAEADKAATEREGKSLRFTKRELQVLRNIVDDHHDSEVETKSAEGAKMAKAILKKLAAAIRGAGHE